MKKTLAVFLSVLMLLLSFGGFTAFAADEQEPDPTCEHNWTVISTVGTATCSNGQIIASLCTKCFGTKTEEGPKDPKNHVSTYTDPTSAKSPTCTEKGKEADVKCLACGKVVTTGKTLKATGHDWGDPVLTVPAGCESEGSKTYVCSRCFQQKTETIKATGHTWKDVRETKAPTCTEEGEKLVQCTVCYKTATQKVAKIAHVDEDGDNHCDVCGTELVKPCACGKVHTGFFAPVVKFFHTIVYFFKNLFKK